MNALTLEERANFYNAAYLRYPDSLLRVSPSRRWMTGFWHLGNNYRATARKPNGAAWYGAYPRGFLPRVQTIFPDATSTLHLFSGSLQAGPYARVDSRVEIFEAAGDVGNEPGGVHEKTGSLVYSEGRTSVRGWAVGSAEHLGDLFGPGTFDMVYADPPYTTKDAEEYDTPMIVRAAVFRSMAEVVRPGGMVAWLDPTLPMHRKDQWLWWGNIAVIQSTNHRWRVAHLFERLRPV